MLYLRCMFLLQLLSLLLVLLLQLLRPGLVSLLSGHLLMFFVLLLLEFLPFLLLLRHQLLLLLLILLVQLRIPRVGRGRTLRRRNILRMDCRACSWRCGAGLATATIPRCVRSSCLLRLHHSAAAKFPRPCRGRDGRPAAVHRRAELLVATCCLHMLSLNCRGRDVSLTRDRFFFEAWDASRSLRCPRCSSPGFPC